MEIKEVLQLLEDYEQKKGIPIVHIEIFSDESGAVKSGSNEEDELIVFTSVEELVAGLKKFD